LDYIHKVVKFLEEHPRYIREFRIPKKLLES